MMENANDIASGVYNFVLFFLLRSFVWKESPPSVFFLHIFQRIYLLYIFSFFAGVGHQAGRFSTTGIFAIIMIIVGTSRRKQEIEC